jgi:hypothetical protein
MKIRSNTHFKIRISAYASSEFAEAYSAPINRKGRRDFKEQLFFQGKN